MRPSEREMFGFQGAVEIDDVAFVSFEGIWAGISRVLKVLEKAS